MRHEHFDEYKSRIKINVNSMKTLEDKVGDVTFV